MQKEEGKKWRKEEARKSKEADQTCYKQQSLERAQQMRARGEGGGAYWVGLHE